MDLEFTPEQAELRHSVRRLLSERAPISYVREMYDDARGTTKDVWGRLCDLGVTGLLVPEQHGGAGMGMVDMAVALEELGRAVHPGPFAASAVGAASLVTIAGTPEDRARLLPGLASGERIGTVALFEPARRANWMSPATTAEPEAAGWRLGGTKVHVPDVVAADLLAVTATDPDGRLGAFVLDLPSGGVDVTGTQTVDGSRKRGTVVLRGATARRLGDGDATEAVAEVVDRLNTAAAVDGVGAAARALELALDYAKTRRQFDVPIGSFQAIQHLCADMLRAVELARAAAYYACWAADAADAAERHRAATMALAFAADELYAVGASAVQVHGGIGYTWEHDVHLFYKRLLTLQQTGGGAVDQLEELATIVLT